MPTNPQSLWGTQGLAQPTAWLLDIEPHVAAVPCLNTASSGWGPAFALHLSCTAEADFTLKQLSEKLWLRKWSTHKVCSFVLMLNIQYACHQIKCHKVHSVVYDEINSPAQLKSQVSYIFETTDCIYFVYIWNYWFELKQYKHIDQRKVKIINLKSLLHPLPCLHYWNVLCTRVV